VAERQSSLFELPADGADQDSLTRLARCSGTSIVIDIAIVE
jgi:hypothetical protein